MPNLSTPLAISISLAALWSVAAIVSPTTTFHLGPLIVAASPVMLGSGRTTTRATTTSLGVAVIASLVLAVADLLRGPSLLPWGGPLTESLVFAAVGSLITVATRVMASRSLVT